MLAAAALTMAALPLQLLAVPVHILMHGLHQAQVIQKPVFLLAHTA
jgi:hypothetical protein